MKFNAKEAEQKINWFVCGAMCEVRKSDRWFAAVRVASDEMEEEEESGQEGGGKK